MTKLEELKNKMLELGIEPKRALGQNFLINSDKINQIMTALSGYQELTTYIEIGPGLGALTNELLAIKKQNIILLELDDVFSRYWMERLEQQPEAAVFHQDALKWNWQLKESNRTALISNLPYQISSSIVIDRSLDQKPLALMILMFQKEVAERIMSKKDRSEFGLLSVIAQSFWDIKNLMDLGTRDFYPSPKVLSRVLLFEPKSPKPNRKEEDFIHLHRKDFLRFVKTAFGHRRKFLISNLAQNYPKELLKEEFSKLKFDVKLRAENLSPAEFAKLFYSLEIT